MCHFIWEKAHTFFASEKKYSLALLDRQMCAMLSGTVIEGLYEGPWMIWGWGEEGALLVVDGDVVVK